VFVESISNVGMQASFGTLQPAGMPGEKRECCGASMKELEARRQNSCCLPFVSIGKWGGDTPGRDWLLGG